MLINGNKARKVHCPQCNTVILWSADNPYRPFCSERCKLIDFGQWATGSYRIPQQLPGTGQTDEEDEH
jgi:endogenous inhibitor of DNA gyrase (YacG/DUF329 family)